MSIDAGMGSIDEAGAGSDDAYAGAEVGVGVGPMLICAGAGAAGNAKSESAAEVGKRPVGIGGVLTAARGATPTKSGSAKGTDGTGARLVPLACACTWKGR